MLGIKQVDIFIRILTVYQWLDWVEVDLLGCIKEWYGVKMFAILPFHRASVWKSIRGWSVILGATFHRCLGPGCCAGRHNIKWRLTARDIWDHLLTLLSFVLKDLLLIAIWPEDVLWFLSWLWRVFMPSLFIESTNRVLSMERSTDSVRQSLLFEITWWFHLGLIIVYLCC